MSASRLLHCKSSVNLTMSVKPDLHVQVSAFSLKVITDNPTFRKTHDGLAYSYRGAHKYPEAAAQDGSGMMVMSLI
jgi:hypothetical protein